MYYCPSCGWNQHLLLPYISRYLSRFQIHESQLCHKAQRFWGCEWHWGGRKMVTGGLKTCHGQHLKHPSGWWFGTFFIFPYIGFLIIPSDFHIFQRGGSHFLLHQGQTTTWTHATGTRSRKDYILVPLPSATLATKSWVGTEHDSTFSHEDHLPVVLECQGWMPVQGKTAPDQWDEQALIDPSRCQQFRQALATLPLPTWDVTVDDHAAIFEQQLLALGRQFFTRKAGKTRPIQLQPDTLGAIQFKRQALDLGRSTGEIADEAFKSELKHIEKDVNRLVRRDVQAHYDDLLQQLQASGDIHDHRMVYRLLHKLGRRKGQAPPGPRPLPLLRASSGQVASTFAEQQNLWMTQFSQVEAGIVTTWDALHQQHSQDRMEPPADVEPDAFPNAWEIQRLLSRLKRDKVPGPNMMPPAILKAGGDVVSRQLSIMFAKTAACAKEPLQWKGGMLVPLWKGKSSPAVPDSYRSIFISNYTAKIYHQCIRTHLVNVWESALEHLQLGGRAGLGSDIAHHALQCHQAWTKSTARPSAILFVDFRSAFYMVLRQTFTSLPSQNAAFMHAMERLGLAPAEIHSLIAQASQDEATAGLSKHLQQILQDMMTNTFFTLKGVEQPCQTTRGTRPGDPVADILFNLCMTLILRDFREYMIEATAIPWMGQATSIKNFADTVHLPTEAFFDITYVDDCAVAMHAKDNSRIRALAQHAVHAIAHAALKRGLQVNFDQGKTELLWNVTGPGTRQLKTELYQAGNMLQWTHQGVSYSVHICHAYKHLGTWMQTRHRHNREVLARAHSAKQQWGQLVRSFFTKRPISLPTKATVFQTLIVSKVAYNVHTWAGVTLKELDLWSSKLKPLIGMILKPLLLPGAKFMHSCEEMFAFAGLLPLQDQIHANRLRFMHRLLQRCPRITWALIQADTTSSSWQNLCLQSCQWMLKHYDRPMAVSATSSLCDWIHQIRLDARWKGRVRKTAALALAYHRARAEQSIWQRHFELRLAKGGATLPAPNPCAPLSERWECEVCSKIFASTRALAMHASREHGYKKKVRYFAIGDTCQACCKMFHTRKRLSVHLEKQPRCYRVVQACWPPMPADLVEALDAEDREAEKQLRKQGWWASKAMSPALTLAGPVLPPERHPACAWMHDRMSLRRPCTATAYDRLQGRQVDRQPAPDPGIWWHSKDIPAFVMHSTGGPDLGNGAFALGGLARAAAKLHVTALVVVHFFSGFRRVGDLHEIIEHQVLESGKQIFVISVDLCMQRQSADLATPQASRWWRDRVFAGQVVSAGGGPPCETYTAARHMEGGPRPLRLPEERQGLPGLTRKEWAQITIGDRLLRFLIDVILALALTGMSGFLEHPQFPVWLAREKAVSIWQMTAIRLLRRLQCVAFVSFDQCTCGAVGKKPTTLMLLRLPRVRDRLLATGDFGRCPHGRGAHEALIGRQHDGTFHTAKAKVYPPGLNRVLGEEMYRSAVQLLTDSTAVALPSVFEEFHSRQFYSADAVQPDYHGGTV